MSTRTTPEVAIAQLQAAAAAKKCWPCGCFHGAITAIEGAIPSEQRDPNLAEALLAGRERLESVRYDCLGCEVCFPAIAMNALEVGGETCPTDAVRERTGWPPLSGAYIVLRFNAPVAVCTLADDRLAQDLAAAAGQAISIVGTLKTENLGIERMIRNILANPQIRFLILCGPDSQQAIGHLPGQSLVALGHSGVDAEMRIVGAKGKRPRLRNLTPEAVDHFRNTVEIVDRIGERAPGAILQAVREAADRNPGPAEPFAVDPLLDAIPGRLPDRMVSDPAGYFVLYPDRRRHLLSLEHYRTDGVLDALIEGSQAAELYTIAIDRGLLSRLDHAAYLGCELARAEGALSTGEEYIQDRAPEQAVSGKPASCGCGGSCGEDNQ